MPERFALIGAARSDLCDEEFVELAREAVCGSGRRPVEGESWNRFAGSLGFASTGEGFEQLGGAIATARDELHDAQLLHYLALPPAAAAGVIEELGRAGSGGGRAGDHGEALRPRPRLGAGARRARPLRLRRGAGLPDRPLHRPRGGAEPARPALCQRHVRAGLEPQPHRSRPDRRAGDALDRDARRLLRGNRRLPRHDRHPPLPGAQLRRDGAAGLAQRQVADDRAREGLRSDEDAGAGRRGPRPVRRATARRRASPPTPTPRPSSPCAPSSTTGAGRASPSSCARASGWPTPTTCSPSPSRSRRGACSRSIARRSPRSTATTTSPSSSAIPARSPLPSWPRCRGRRCSSARPTCASATPTASAVREQALDAYERLIYDVMVGDRTLFTTSAAIERLWEIADPVVREPPPVEIYEPGSWGPEATEALLAPHRWHVPSDHP